MDNRKNILILYGGKSVEHSVSINSATNVNKYIDRDLFNPICIGISRSGKWHLTDGVVKNIESGKPIEISLSPIAIKADNITLKIDLVFPLLHGTNGEDGSIQGFFQVLEKPILGSGVLGSAVNMSKLTTKKILKSSGIPIIDFLQYNYNDVDYIDFDVCKDKLGLPFIVKSANLGSSVGITKVSSKEDFKKAIEAAFQFDRQILIEKFVEARELECAVMGNYNPQSSNPGEIVIDPNYEFYNFKAKYVDEKAVSIEIPAKIENTITQKIKSLCEKAYTVLDCEDYARVDLFLMKNGDIYINEINTIPGFTDASMFPMMWKEQGISFPSLITKLINIAFERFKLKLNIKTDYFSELD